MTMTRWRLAPTVLALAAVLLAMLAPVAEAQPAAAACENRNINDKIDKFLDCIDADDAFEHLQALQDIADANGGTRASGTPGYDQSVDYVAGLLDDAGYTVEIQEFTFATYTEISSELLVDGESVEAQSFTYSGAGTVTDGNVVPVDLELGIGNLSSSACEPADFDGLDFSGDNDIALTQRGGCGFADKAVNAQAAGAEAVIIFNQGNSEDRTGIINGRLGDGLDGVVIPAIDTTYATGELIATSDVTVSLTVEREGGPAETTNVIADLQGNNPDNVVMAGAHLDSVPEGAGIQDNGSGSAAILEVALAMAENRKFTPENSLRFAWWGAEERGLIGSTEYIFNPEFGITQEEYDALALYLNFDMIASPNFFYGVYDADESSFDAPVFVPPGSAELEDLFEAYYSANDIPYEDSEFSGRSDYQAFIDVGIPASGLFTGAEVLKTEEQQAIWGGVAGEQFDQCYHLACDTIDNVSMEALEVNLDAVAYAMFSVALDTSLVNGVEGREIRGDYEGELDGPQFTFVDGTGGGGLADHDHEHDIDRVTS